MVARFGGREVASVATDHGGDLQLVVEELAPRRDRDVVVWADERVRVGEVERRRLVPARMHLPGRLVESHHAFDMPLEGEEIADRRRVERGEQPDRRERHCFPGRLRAVGLTEQVEHAHRIREEPKQVAVGEGDARTGLRRDPRDPHTGAAVTCTDLIVSPTKSASGGGVCSISQMPICREISQISRHRG